jgi:hypothetical protein
VEGREFVCEIEIERERKGERESVRLSVCLIVGKKKMEKGKMKEREEGRNSVCKRDGASACVYVCVFVCVCVCVCVRACKRHCRKTICYAKQRANKRNNNPR